MPVGSVYLRRQDGAWVLSLVGEHDLTTQSMLTDQIRRLTNTGDGLVVDLRRAEFIDSTVIHAVRAAHAEADGGKPDRFAIVVRNGATASRVVSLVGLDRVIPAFEHLETAIRTVTARSPQDVDDGIYDQSPLSAS